MKKTGNREFVLKTIQEKSSDFWTSAREKHSLALFKKASKEISSYKNFLSKHKVKAENIKTWQDFEKLPVITKKNYLRKFKLEELCWNGSLQDKSLLFTATSGSTGNPFYFPRSDMLDEQSSILHELFLRNDKENKQKSTLVVIGFGFGVWIGGLITLAAFRKIAINRGYNISIITPGTNKKEIFEAVKSIGSKFDQVILCGYPPFIKDIIDEGKSQKIKWQNLSLKIIFAAEAFSEKFRDYIVRAVGIKNLYTETINIYGSADLGTMAFETPLSILIRRMSVNNEALFKSLFPHVNRLPTLAQFNPLFTNFEAINGEILCTADNVLPLIRYAIGDHGGVMTFNEVEKILQANNINIKAEAKKLGIEDTIHELPFVYVYERSDLSTKLYGAIIYPEHIKHALAHNSLEDFLTSKFTLQTKHDDKENQYMEINIELRPGVTENPVLAARTMEMITETLIEKNAEYNYLANMMPGRVDPRITFWQYEHPAYFRPGVKQKWVLK